MEPDMPAADTAVSAPQQLSAKDIVGAAPPSTSSSQGLVGFLNRREQEKAEATQRKFEKWNEVMMKKQKEKEARANAAG